MSAGTPPQCGPDPIGGAYSAPPNPVAGSGGLFLRRRRVGGKKRERREGEEN